MRATETAEIEGLRALFAAAPAEVAAAQGIGVLDLGRSQNGILAGRIARAAERGCTLIVTETGERLPDRPSNSYRNILRNGFREA